MMFNRVHLHCFFSSPNVLAVEKGSAQAELASYKAEVRTKFTAVGKAEIVMNEVCLAMARSLGHAKGTRISTDKGHILPEVCCIALRARQLK